MSAITAEYLAESQAPVLVGVAVGFIAATSIVIGLRLYTRLIILRCAGPDDWSILVAMAFAIITSVSTCFEAKHGMGRHKEAVKPEDSPEQLKYLYICILNYNMGMNIVKISFLLHFRRIFEAKLIQKICFWSMVYVALWACTQVTLLGVSCLPISFLVPSTAAWCIDTLPVWYFSSAMSLATDILIFCIPLPSVIKLNLKIKQKIMVIGIFCLGFFVCIISVYRMCTLKGAVTSQDPPWDNVGAAIWSVIELNCAIICASLPTLRPLVAKIVPGMSSNHSNRATYERYGSKYAMESSSRSRTKPSRSTPQSISTEELALNEMEPGLHSGPTSAYIRSNGWKEDQLRMQENSGQIMVTTETVIRKH